MRSSKQKTPKIIIISTRTTKELKDTKDKEIDLKDQKKPTKGYKYALHDKFNNFNLYIIKNSQELKNFFNNNK